MEAAELSDASPAELLADFRLFRLAYLGHVSTPWQLEAIDRLSELLRTPDAEFVVLNCPPGAGKSTLGTDWVTWEIVRRRRLRALCGAYSADNAAKATERVKSYLEADVPVFADPDDVARGAAVQPTRVLSADFGVFKPSERGGAWRKDRFRVEFADGFAASEKEFTLEAFGRGGSVMGNRFDLLVWDDLVTEDVTRSPEQNNWLLENWTGAFGESRLEPDRASLLLLIGQRIGPHDLYRRCVDMRSVEFVDGAESTRAKYTHIKYPAHFDDVCVGVHDRATARSWPYGCLLDAERLPWYGNVGLVTKRTNSPRTYDIQYQQLDGSDEDALIQNTWIFGGADSEGVHRPGNINHERCLGSLPKNWDLPLVSIATVDPSPSKYWAVQWWVYSPGLNMRALMGLHDRRMTANLLLDTDGAKGWVGVLEDIWRDSAELGVPMSHAVVEINAAQRFLLPFKHARAWMKARNVTVLSHTTHRNKLDPDMGLSILREPFQAGRFDLPYGDVVSRGKVALLANQLMGQHERDDQLMAAWFLEHNLQRIAPRLKALPNMWRPSWQRRSA